MKLEQIQFVHFRNHASLTFVPSGGINLIYGPNGSGKTSILEGIHYCALTKGFVSAYDIECLKEGNLFFLVKGKFASESGTETEVKVSYSRQNGKQLNVNSRNIATFSSHIGVIPCITFSPSDLSIIAGSPAERRRFLDNAICQTDTRYLDALLNYRRILQQRNALLFQIREHRSGMEMLDILTEQIAEHAACIVSARIRFIREILPLTEANLVAVSAGETPHISYRCSFFSHDNSELPDQLSRLFKERIREKRQEEISRAQTAIGPHRDDLLFFLNEKEIKKYASQGQKRSFIITLKLALYRYFLDKLDEQPICLFDDLFSELDHHRVDALLLLLSGFGQSIITTTEKREIAGVSALNICEIA
ncbi:MAG: DNA replication and repair protein RecF [Chlorobium sp.]|uniref:DNA replication/repair protein RecF n=1 Tax=Chlorobium sp. TaxID=1095 RepID=UPI0025BA1E65|nr:DNA replication and repair protein RecF [Chlorobium sp.]MCF8382222.1 DNA replication and repair protein RecF [Chlorobium sp.]